MTHPIIPPPELVQQWAAASPLQIDDETYGYELFIAHRAAQWGADQELEACLDWLDRRGSIVLQDELRAARRPKPPQLKEQAQQALSRFDCNAHTSASEMMADFAAIRRALEVLPDD
jgi:hypothetical protein